MSLSVAEIRLTSTRFSTRFVGWLSTRNWKVCCRNWKAEHWSAEAWDPTRPADSLRSHVFRQSRPPVSHRRQAKFLGEEATHRGVTRPKGGSLHLGFFDDFDERAELLST